MTEFPKYLATSGTDAFIRADPIDSLATSAERRNRRRRYLYQYRRPRPDSSPASLRAKLRRRTVLLVDIVNNLQPFVHIYKFPDDMPWRVGFRAVTTPFTDNRPCWFGSVWMTLSSHAVSALISATRNRQEYVGYLGDTVNPDESATASLLCNDPSVRVTNRRMHYVRWTSPKSGHPDILGVADVAELQAAEGFFARKFDARTDAEVFDQLDQFAQRC